MQAESLFSLAGLVVLPGWLLLLVAPHWRYSASLISSVIIPSLLAAAYSWLIIQYFGDSDGGFGSLAELRTAFLHDFILLAGWIHYLAFDLFIGSWEVRDSRQLGIHHVLVVPCLLLTFLLGPIGLLLYLVIRAAVTRKVQIRYGA